MAIANPLTRLVDGNEVPVPGLWKFDPGHTEAAFEGTHLLVNRVRGRFSSVSGHLLAAERPEDSRGEIVIETASLASGSKERDEHLRSPDWLDVDAYPRITFRSTGLDFISGSTWLLNGKLSIKGISRAVEARATFGGGVTDPWGNDKIGFAVAAEIDRELWNMRWNVPLPGGGLAVSRRVWLKVSVEASRAS